MLSRLESRFSAIVFQWRIKNGTIGDCVFLIYAVIDYCSISSLVVFDPLRDHLFTSQELSHFFLSLSLQIPWFSDTIFFTTEYFKK